jgi:prophage antirepressor-like protein
MAEEAFTDTENIVPVVFKRDHIEETIRIVPIEGKPWFVTADALRTLGLDESHGARTVKAREKGLHRMATLGGTQQMGIISLQGLLRLCMRSDKPYAQTFQDWLVYEVIPQIIDTGRYITPGLKNDDLTPASRSDLIAAVQTGVIKGIDRILPPLLMAIGDCATKKEHQQLILEVHSLDAKFDVQFNEIRDIVNDKLGSRKPPSKTTNDMHRLVTHQCYAGFCPYCGRKKIVDDGGRWILNDKEEPISNLDHLSGRHNNDFWSFFPLCADCHTAIGKSISVIQVADSARVYQQRAETIGIKRPAKVISLKQPNLSFKSAKSTR